MRIIRSIVIIFFIIIFQNLFSLKHSFSLEIGGIKLYQSIENIVNLEEYEIETQKTFYKDGYFEISNNTFNSKSLVETEYHNRNDFNILKPDFLFDQYNLNYNKNSNLAYIVKSIEAYKIIDDKIIQEKFEVGRCKVLREQLIAEKFNLNPNIFTSSRVEYIRGILYKDDDNNYTDKLTDNFSYDYHHRIIYDFSLNNLPSQIEFTCSYEIQYVDENHFVSTTFYYGSSEKDYWQSFYQKYDYKKIDPFNENYIKSFKIWGNFEINENDENMSSEALNYSLSMDREERYIGHLVKLEKLAIEEAKQRLEQEKLDAQKKAEQEKLDAQKKAKEKIKKLNLEIDKIIEDYRKKIADISKPIKISKKKISILKNNLLNESNKIKVLETKYPKQNDAAKQYLTKDLELNCFINVARNLFLGKIVSVKVNLKYIKKKSSTSTLYSVNFEPFKKDPESFPEFYVYLDYLNSENIERCNVSDPRISTLELLDLNEIKFRHFNNVTDTIKMMEDFKINKKTKKKIKTLEQNSNKIKNLITAEKKILTSEKKNYFKSEKELINKFSTKIFEIEKKISVIGKNLNIEQNRSIELVDISALIDVSKKNVEENDSQTDKVIQDQDKSVGTTGLSLSEEDALKAQIFGCWSIPLGLPLGENLLVRIKLKLKPDGTVISSEVLDHARMNESGQKFYKVLAESALRAIRLCQPLRVPSTGYERWKDLQLNFDAREMLEG